MGNPLPLSLTGAPVTTSADPNGTAPSSLSTTWTSPPHAESGDDASALELELVDGTSATVMLWLWVQGTEWAQLGSVALSAVHVVSAPVGAFGGGATIYPQVTAVAGSPTTIRAGFTRPLPGATPITATVTGGATSANQTSGAQKTQIVDSAGTHTMPAGDAAARALFVEVTDGTHTMPTGDAAARPVFVELTDGTHTTPAGDAAARPIFVNGVVASTSTDTGQNLSLGDTASHVFASSAVATLGVMVSAPISNTAPVYIGLASGVTSGATGKGIELLPGDREFFPGVLNANLLFAITGTATQNVHALAI